MAQRTLDEVAEAVGESVARRMQEALETPAQRHGRLVREVIDEMVVGLERVHDVDLVRGEEELLSGLREAFSVMAPPDALVEAAEKIVRRDRLGHSIARGAFEGQLLEAYSLEDRRERDRAVDAVLEEEKRRLVRCAAGRLGRAVGVLVDLGHVRESSGVGASA